MMIRIKLFLAGLAIGVVGAGIILTDVVMTAKGTINTTGAVGRWIVFAGVTLILAAIVLPFHKGVRRRAENTTHG